MDRWLKYETPFGPGAVVFSGQGVRRLILPHQDEGGLEETMLERYPEVEPLEDNAQLTGQLAPLAELREQLEAYFKGERVAFRAQLDLSGLSDFTRQVYRTLALVGYGQLTSYRRLAEDVGRPLAWRAVGNAMARNPLPVLVPCHRVLKSDGGVGGWSGKPGWKERLIGIERVG